MEGEMIITNNYQLPENLVKAVTYDSHRKADYSVTELLDPPRLTILKKRHDAEIKQDASDLIWRLLGSAIHVILERGQQAHQLTEEYLTKIIMGQKISGIPDLYELPGIITDYKITSAWSVVYESRTKHWEEQLNCYAYFYIEHGFPVQELRNILILRDWSRSKAASDSEYPQQKVIQLNIPLWPVEKIEQFMIEKLTHLLQVADVPDNDLPLCPADERWQKKSTWAVMKEGRKSAVRVFDTEFECKSYLADPKNNAKGNFSIVPRPGEDTRCLYYCPCNTFCNHYQELLTSAQQTKGE
jgi:hypothetical protein